MMTIKEEYLLYMKCDPPKEALKSPKAFVDNYLSQFIQTSIVVSIISNFDPRIPGLQDYAKTYLAELQASV